MPILDAKTLCKSFGDRTLLRDVDLTIVRGEKVGIVGDNGGGKSTLARILAGLMEPDLGTVSRRKGARVDYLPQDPTLPAGQTALEVVLGSQVEWNQAKARYEEALTELAAGTELERTYEKQASAQAELEALGGYDKAERASRMLEHLGITDPGQSVDTMSGGERRRVAMAGLLLRAPDLLILDEPTNHLDGESIEWLENYLDEQFQGALLLITHDRFLLNRVVTRTLEVDGGKVYAYQGGWEAFLVARAERLSQEERKEQNRQNYLRKEIEWLRRQPKARTGKQKARIDRAESALSEKAPTIARTVDLELVASRQGGIILEARHLNVGIGSRTLIRDVSFQLAKKARLGILGRSGAGKTTLLRTLLGSHPALSGELVIGKNTRVAYLDQLRTGLDDGQTIYEAIADGRPTVTLGESSYSTYAYLEKFKFRGEAVRQKIAGLSGGERARVALAKLLLEPANLLVLDEPTNDLDVMTLGSLEELLLSMEASALLVSHDRYFLDRVATQVLGIEEDGSCVLLHGGYSALSEYRETEQSRKKAMETERPAPKVERPKAKRGLSWAEEKELSGLEGRLDQLSREVAELEERLSDPELYGKPFPELAALRNLRDERKAELDGIETRWLELEEKKQS